MQKCEMKKKIALKKIFVSNYLSHFARTTRFFESWKKKEEWTKLLNVVPRKNFLFFVEKNFFFWLAAGRSGAERRPKAGVERNGALPPTKKKSFFQQKKESFF